MLVHTKHMYLLKRIQKEDNYHQKCRFGVSMTKVDLKTNCSLNWACMHYQDIEES
uniref:Uncharacterized protein n=1 Tax=Octopus bimaculoides TaxID=37653 RepID=A0A0L8H6X3_OCTBM